MKEKQDKSLTAQIANNCVPGLTNHYSTNGIYLAIGLMMFSSSFLFEEGKNRRKSKIWLVLIVLALLLTGKRAHLLFSVFSIGVMWLLCSP